MADIELDKATNRIDAGEQAGNQYIDDLESIRDELTRDDDQGATLGTMVAAQLKMTEVETQYMVEAGIPKKASSTHMAAAKDVKKASG